MNAHKLKNEKVVINMAYKKKAELEMELAEALQKIEQLELEIKHLKADNRRTLEFAVQEIEETKKSVHKIKNERNAGRKSKFGNEEKGRITMLFLQGKSYRAIAKEMNCSLGLVHKILNEQPKGNKE